MVLKDGHVDERYGRIEETGRGYDLNNERRPSNKCLIFSSTPTSSRSKIPPIRYHPLRKVFVNKVHPALHLCLAQCAFQHIYESPRISRNALEAGRALQWRDIIR